MKNHKLIDKMLQHPLLYILKRYYDLTYPSVPASHGFFWSLYNNRHKWEKHQITITVEGKNPEHMLLLMAYLISPKDLRGIAALLSVLEFVDVLVPFCNKDVLWALFHIVSYGHPIEKIKVYNYEYDIANISQIWKLYQSVLEFYL